MAITRPYEVTLVFRPDLDEADFTAALDKTKGWMTSAGGTVAQTNVWGRRRLAYPINKLTEGQYVLFVANLPAQALSGLEREFRLNEEILRFLIVRVEE